MSNWSAGDVTANGINIHYHRTGGASKSPIVLSHGFSDNGLCWTRVAQVLEKDFDVIMVDARGHGQSDAPEGAYTTPVHAADLAGLIQALDLAKPALMGHSMGAATTAMTAALHPDLVACAVLEDPPWFAPNTLRVTASPQEREAWSQARRERIERFKQMTHAEVVQAGRAKDEHPTWDEVDFGPWAEAKQQMSPNVFEGNHRRGIQEMRGRWQDIVPQIQCPTLLITADCKKDGIVTLETARQIAQMNPRINVVHLPGAGHNVRRERYEPFIWTVTGFLSQVHK